MQRLVADASGTKEELERTLKARKDAERTVSKLTEGKGINSPDQEGRAQAHQNRTQRQNRTNEEKQTTERQKERHNTHKNGDRRRQEQKEEGEEKVRSDKTSDGSPTRRRNLVTDQTRATTDRPGRASQDCARVFPVKGASWCHEANQWKGRKQCVTRTQSKSRLPGRPGTNLSRKPPRQAGQRWPHSATEVAVPWKKAHLRDSISRKTSATVGEAAERWEVRSKEETEKSQASAKPDIPLGTQTSAGRRPAAAGGGEPGGRPRPGPPGSGEREGEGGLASPALERPK